MAHHNEPAELASVLSHLPKENPPPSIRDNHGSLLDEKNDFSDEKLDSEKHSIPVADYADLDDMARLDNDDVLETAQDFSVALVSLEDDNTLPVNTFRMWFCGLGFAGFGSVLGMLFVSHNSLVMVEFKIAASDSNSGPKLFRSHHFSFKFLFLSSGVHSRPLYLDRATSGITTTGFGSS
jgi:hypothetical protein